MRIHPEQFHRETPDSGDVLFGYAVYSVVAIRHFVQELWIGIADPAHVHECRRGTAYHTSRALAGGLIMSIFATGLAGVEQTHAFYSDPEESTGNTMTAGLLDIAVEPVGPLAAVVGIQDGGNYAFSGTTTAAVGSLGTQYRLTTEYVSGDIGFCDDLAVTATLPTITPTTDTLLSLMTGTTTDFGNWTADVSLEATTTTAHDNTCEVDFVWTAWRSDSTATSTSGYYDTERLRVEFTANMIVMNEVIPNPTGADSQAGVLGEWIELYNNGAVAIDVAGWMLSEETGGGTENLYTIVASSTGPGEWGTLSGTTTIAPGDFQVVLIDGARLNNTGDTIRLYDDGGVLLDEFTFTGAMAPEGKSIARIPDGIGAWIDPVPTPGSANKLVGEFEALVEPEEVNQCTDDIDNDGDGWVDGNDAGCEGPEDMIEDHPYEMQVFLGLVDEVVEVEETGTTTATTTLSASGDNEENTDTGTSTRETLEDDVVEIEDETGTSTAVLLDNESEEETGTTTPQNILDDGETASSTPLLIDEGEDTDTTATSTPVGEDNSEEGASEEEHTASDVDGEQVPVPDDENHEVPQEDVQMSEPPTEEVIENVVEEPGIQEEESPGEETLEEDPGEDSEL